MVLSDRTVDFWIEILRVKNPEGYKRVFGKNEEA